jgi:signal transduction histidine kinase
MLSPASPEFVALCRSQIVLLTQGLGAALSIVYLTEEFTDVADAKLVPVVAYPEAVANWGEDQILSLLVQSRRSNGATQRLLLEAQSPDDRQAMLPALPPPRDGGAKNHPLEAAERALLRQQQIILPLIHEDVVMGLLVTARADRAWNPSEQAQIEQIAETLAIACLLDQRAQWLAHDLRQQQLLDEQKHDLFDNLLHQFRNPLTALRTFGKLLVKRLRPGDANRTVAEGIVRESDRLQDLLQQFDAAINLGEADLQPLLQAAPSTDIEAHLESDSGASTPTQGWDANSPLLLPGTNWIMGTSMQIEPHSIAEVLEPLLDSTLAIAQDRQLDVYTDIPVVLSPVQIDVRALREVLSNLIDNALKYTPEGGQVYIRIFAQQGDHPNQQAIVIADTGPGIPPEDQVHLFERHYRGVQAETEIPGTGLGLAIARDLVSQMQGEIQVFSPADTSGFVPPQNDEAATRYPGTAVVVWLSEAHT